MISFTPIKLFCARNFRVGPRVCPCKLATKQLLVYYTYQDAAKLSRIPCVVAICFQTKCQTKLRRSETRICLKCFSFCFKLSVIKHQSPVFFNSLFNQTILKLVLVFSFLVNVKSNVVYLMGLLQNLERCFKFRNFANS